MSLVQEGTLAGFVSFVTFEGEEEVSFEGEREASVFFMVRADVRAEVLKFISFEILSVFELIRSVNPCSRTPYSTSFLKSSFIIFKMGFILVLYSLQFSLRILGTSFSWVQAASRCSK